MAKRQQERYRRMKVTKPRPLSAKAIAKSLVSGSLGMGGDFAQLGMMAQPGAMMSPTVREAADKMPLTSEKIAQSMGVDTDSPEFLASALAPGPPGSSAMKLAKVGSAVKKIAAATPVVGAIKKATKAKLKAPAGAAKKPKSYVPVSPENTNVFIDDFPIIDPQDLVGKKVFPIVSDLTDGGTVYTGIDSSRVDVPEQLMGGPKYPGLASSRAAGSLWATQGLSKARQKLYKDADYAIVVSMMPESHQSNTSFVNSTLKTLGAYARDGRISSENMQAIDELIRTPTANPAHEKLADFPGLESDNLMEYLQSLNFESRSRIAEVVGQKEAQKLGAPNLTKMLRATQDPRTFGMNRNDAILVVEIDKKSDLVKLGEEPGTVEHPSYQYGVKGRVVGKFAGPVNYETIWKNWIAKKKEEGTTGLVRSFDLNLPVVEITQDIADNIPTAPMQAIQSPRQAKLVIDTMEGNWKTTDQLATKGGIKPTEFVDALQASDASSSLTPYTLKDVQKMIRSKDMKLYQLGEDGQIFFGLKKNYNFLDEYGFEHPELTPNETAIVGVVNNEPGAKGVAGPSVMLKAIEDGATALDAFAVPSKKYPRGFLPKLYNEYGFEELGRVPFIEEFYLQERTVQELNDLKDYWRSTGWDESMGMPEVVIMKWKGDDALRSDATSRFFNDGQISPRRQTPGAATAAIDGAGQRTGPDTGRPSESSGVSDAGGDSGSIRTDSGPRLSGRIRSVVSELENLTPTQISNLGLNPEAVKNLRSARVKQASEQILEEAMP